MFSLICLTHLFLEKVERALDLFGGATSLVDFGNSLLEIDTRFNRS